MKDIPGAWVEENKYTFSVHYRMVEKSKVSRVEEIVDDFMQSPHGQGFNKHFGKMVFEIKPKLKWNKGEALKWIMRTLKVDQDPATVPIYIGDDVTDEDAFKVLATEAPGVSIIVSPDSTKQTNAKYRLRDPSDVKSFLDKFVSQ